MIACLERIDHMYPARTKRRPRLAKPMPSQLKGGRVKPYVVNDPFDFYFEHDGQLLIVGRRRDPNIPTEIYTGYSVTIHAGKGREAAMVNARVPFSRVRVHVRYLKQLCEKVERGQARNAFMKKFHSVDDPHGTQYSSIWENLVNVIQSGIEEVQ